MLKCPLKCQDIPQTASFYCSGFGSPFCSTLDPKPYNFLSPSEQIWVHSKSSMLWQVDLVDCDILGWFQEKSKTLVPQLEWTGDAEVNRQDCSTVPCGCPVQELKLDGWKLHQELGSAQGQRREEWAQATHRFCWDMHSGLSSPFWACNWIRDLFFCTQQSRSDYSGADLVVGEQQLSTVLTGYFCTLLKPNAFEQQHFSVDVSWKQNNL